MPVELRVATKDDLPEIVDLHMRNLSGDLVDFGPSVVTKFYLNGFLKETLTVICASENEKITGMAVFTFDEASVFKENLVSSLYQKFELFLNANKLAFVKALLRKMLNRDEGIDNGVSLLYLTVDKKSRGKGTGQKLLESGEKILLAKDIFRYHLQVKCSNVSAINFYLKYGFIITSHVESRNLLVLDKQLSIL